MAQRSISQDIRRVSRVAATIGVVLALVCKVLPADSPVKRPCDLIAAVCRGLGGLNP